MVTVINPSVIADATPEVIKPDLKKFDKAKEQVSLVVAELKKYESIDNKEKQNDAMAILKTASEVDKAIEKKRTELVKPWNDGVKAINNYVKELTADLGPGIQKVKDACLSFQKAEEEKARQQMISQRQNELVALGFIYNPASDQFALDKVGSVSTREISNYDASTWNKIIYGYQETIKRNNESLKQNLLEEQDLVEAFGTEEDKNNITSQIAQADINPVIPSRPTNGYHAEKLKGVTKRWTFDITDESLIPREYLQVNLQAIRNAISEGVREIPGLNIYQSESLTIR